MKNTVFIFGFGYSAAYFSKLLLNQNYSILATTRNHADKEYLVKKLCLESDDFKLVDYNDPKSVISGLENSQYVLISTPPLKNGTDPVLQEYIDNILDVKNQLIWLGYLSTTGVYGDYKGDWVDEKSKCLATNKRSLNRINIENKYLDLYKNNLLPTHIFRVAGIYGPQRSSIDKLQHEKTYSIYKQNHYFSRIHVEDIAGALYQSILQPTAGEIYNLCDDMPAQSHEVDAFAAKLLNVKKPELKAFEEANLSEMAKEFFQANRKVSNKKIKTKLGYKFKYSNYMSGLQGIIKKNMS